ncbi:M20 family metallopeptidase [Staphylococcus arlettae]|uniref:M20 family metallopeptidase n=1 Tax=Staphylococcus arlettae TaxID=29378 RepID=UPI002DBDCE5D|nr:M20 family metallopeptidase [Staphylococcus arlettae]MEB7422265.1 M20 family metallopeptidase [Staphylococcus arlettae]
MNQSNIEFLQSLITIDSTNPPGNEAAVTELFKTRCEQNDVPYEITDLGNNRNNFSVTLTAKDNTEDKLLLSGHTDTVKIGAQQWQYGPFAAAIDNGKLYGRGTTDMKSGLAALYLALESLYKEGFTPTKNIEFLATAGEEVDSIGAEHYVASTNMDNIKAIIIAEPTSEKVVVGHKGALWIEVTLTGKTAHGAMPEQGINAIEGMNKVLNLVDELKEEWLEEQAPLGKSSISANLISGGIQTNVIPDSCTLNVDIRSVTPNLHEKLYSEFTERLEAIFSAENSPEVSTKILLNRATVLTEEDESIITSALDVANANEVSGVSYYTDGSVLNPDSNIPTLIYGPGIETLAHQPNEYVEVDAFERSIEYFKKLIKVYTG